VSALYRVVGIGPDGEREEGIARPRVEAMRIFDAVLADRGADFGPYADVRLLVEPVASTR
jgi:hypothetical protein